MTHAGLWQEKGEELHSFWTVTVDVDEAARGFTAAKTDILIA